MNGTINQFHSGTAVGDAVTNQMIGLKKTIFDLGYKKTKTYAEFIPDSLKKEFDSIFSYSGNENNILLVHHSMGISEKAFEKILSLPDKKVLIYHNITPEKYFKNDFIINAIREGFKQVLKYKDCFDYFVADSNYNRKDLLSLGFKNNIDVFPVSISLDRFSKIKENEKLLEKYSNTSNLLFVGRIVKNKHQDDVIKAFAAYHYGFNTGSKLFLVGDFGDNAYFSELKDLTDSLDLKESVIFTGKVSEEDLKAYYMLSDVFLCMSEHEGFGVPLLEAMKMNVAVVAFRSSAVPETLGGAGIISNNRDYVALGALIDEILKNNKLKDGLLNAQKKRIEKIESIDNSELVKKVSENVLSGKRTRTLQLQGPFETSYSLAIVNRKLAEALDKRKKYDVSIYCTEGPGDYTPQKENLADKPHAKALWLKSKDEPYPDVTIRNMYPPRVNDVIGGLNFQSFGWEESVIPREYIENFNKYLDGIGTTSDYVTDKLIECGIKIPVRTMGNGVELLPGFENLPAFPLKTRKKIKFLHISSAFPRKGVDILLEAFFETFSKDDDVCLVLKTFPNPHNNVAEILRSLQGKFKNSPEVEWIDRDLSQEKLESLYKAADCYVSVSRGEGFGLPLAEAMLAKLPVIVSPNTGMADFCNEDTALLVGYDLIPARTHITVFDGGAVSLWAEPRKEELKKQLKRFACNVNSTEIRKKVDFAYNLISSRFSWEEVAKRWEGFIDDVEALSRVPKVGMVSSWNDKCGIAEYTHLQIDALGKSVDYQIFPNKGNELIKPDEDFVKERTWQSATDENLDALKELLIGSDREIVHIQFSFGFFSPDCLGDLIDSLVDVKKKVVITFHNTANTHFLNRMFSLRTITDNLNKCAALVIHQKEDFERLKSFGVKENLLRLINLGQIMYPYSVPEFSRKMLDISSSPVIGTYGFCLPHKGVKEIIQAMPAVLEKYPEAKYYAVCSRYPNSISTQYIDECKGEINRLYLEKNVELVTDYLTNDESMRYLQACDILCMPYKPSKESASGAVRFCLAALRPTITTKQDIFNEVSSFTKQIRETNPKLIAQAIIELYEDKELQGKYINDMSEYIKITNWYSTAEKYKKLYLDALSD